MGFRLLSLSSIVLMLIPKMTTATSLSNVFQNVQNSTLLTILMETTDTNVSLPCRTALKELKEGIAKSEYWAMKMLDATGKIASGILDLTVLNFGSYDECLSIHMTSNVSENKSNYAVGQYCAAILNPKRINHSGELKPATSIRWDICAPSWCSPRDLSRALFSASNSIVESVEVTFCSVLGPPTFNTYQIVSLVILSTLAFLLLSGTLIDVLCQVRYHLSGVSENRSLQSASESKGKTRIFLECFSMYSNANRLLDLKQNRIEFVDGLRVLSIAWVIVCHTYLQGLKIFGNMTGFLRSSLSISFQGIINTKLVLDTFFVISGFFVVYSNIKKLPNINWFHYYIHRYLRLTPPVAVSILFTFLWPLMGSGPNWNNFAYLVRNCQSRWWLNLIYMNNINPMSEQCLDHFWFLAVDMQLYIFSPIVLYSLWRWPYVGYFISGVVLIASVAIQAAFVVLNDINQGFVFPRYQKSWLNTEEGIYTTPYGRMAPYCMGMVLGYVLATKQKMDLSPIAQTILWCLASVLTVSALFGKYSWFTGVNNNVYVNTLYFSTYQIAWCLGIVWLIYACFHGCGGILTRILSWRPFKFLAKLTYMVYVAHIFLIWSFFSFFGERLMFNQFVVVVIALGFITLSFGVSFLLCLCAEIPFQRLEEEFVRSRI